MKYHFLVASHNKNVNRYTMFEIETTETEQNGYALNGTLHSKPYYLSINIYQQVKNI